MSEQFKAALVRAFVGGIVSAGSVFFSIMSIMGAAGVGKAGIAAGASFFGVLAARGFGEGSYDTNRDRRGSTPPSGWSQPLGGGAYARRSDGSEASLAEEAYRFRLS
jgi:hypothetical protein